MLNSNLFIIVTGLIVAVFAVCKSKKSLNEAYINVPLTTRLSREVAPVSPNSKVGSPHGIPVNYRTMLGNDKFISRPNFQASLSPRFSNVNYGANIRYNLPNYKNTAVPCDPMSLGDMAKENYSKRQPVKEQYSCSQSVDCNRGLALGGATTPVSADPNYVSAMDRAYAESSLPLPGNSLLPVKDMTTITPEGDVENSIVYDRYMYANRYSRLRSLGDWIRGDLPIVPSTGNWFNVSVTPHIDLNTGAINVLAGVDNNTNQQLANLMRVSSGYDLTVGGMDMTNQFDMLSSAGEKGLGGDIQVRTFI